MALDGNALGKAIASAIMSEANKEKITPETIWIAIANEIVEHFKNNAEVTVDAGIQVTTTGKCPLSSTDPAELTGTTIPTVLTVPFNRTGQTTETGTGSIS